MRLPGLKVLETGAGDRHSIQSSNNRSVRNRMLLKRNDIGLAKTGRGAVLRDRPDDALS